MHKLAYNCITRHIYPNTKSMYVNRYILICRHHPVHLCWLSANEPQQHQQYNSPLTTQNKTLAATHNESDLSKAAPTHPIKTHIECGAGYLVYYYALPPAPPPPGNSSSTHRRLLVKSHWQVTQVIHLTLNRSRDRYRHRSKCCCCFSYWLVGGSVQRGK